MFAMRTILYPTDFSADTRPAFEAACALAAEGSGRRVVLHAERPPLATLTFRTSTAIPQKPSIVEEMGESAHPSDVSSHWNREGNRLGRNFLHLSMRGWPSFERIFPDLLHVVIRHCFCQ